MVNTSSKVARVTVLDLVNQVSSAKSHFVGAPGTWKLLYGMTCVRVNCQEAHTRKHRIVPCCSMRKQGNLMYTACLTLTTSNSRTKLTFDTSSSYSALTIGKIIHRVFYQICIITTLRVPSPSSPRKRGLHFIYEFDSEH